MISIPDFLHSLASYYHWFLLIAAITIGFLGTLPVLRPIARFRAGERVSNDSARSVRL